MMLECVLLFIMFYIIVSVLLFVVLIVVLIVVFYFLLNKRNSLAPLGAHVLITGGSSGIGLAVAIEARKLGANVTIVARDAMRLSEAMTKILAEPGAKGSWVHTISLDVTGDWNVIKEAIDALVQSHGSVHVLINSAGFAISHYFEDGDQRTFERMMQLNYLGSVAVTHAIVPHMRRDTALGVGGCICFVSSMAGQLGVFGLTGYSASKFALRGLAEALHYELFEDNISVTLAFPPDTDTPGFEREQEGKPIETKTISEIGGLVKPEKVASKLVRDTLQRHFFSSIGYDGWLMSTITTGMAPTDHFPQALFRGLVSCTVQMVGTGYRYYMRRLIHKNSTRLVRRAKLAKSN